ncbi:unnamed protein product [Strongylus vulgaris]|uniref:Uncharacterized protein n=1 Tax=Strongylus vulgaris TaxID=40348 RepID=A0A3P7K4Y7_STRVU|nr:unnamed protein product [Strongylus vulgaris]
MIEFSIRNTGSDVEQIVKMLSLLLPDSGLHPWEVTKEDQVLITLRYLATNSHQTVIADCFGRSQKAKGEGEARRNWILI